MFSYLFGINNSSNLLSSKPIEKEDISFFDTFCAIDVIKLLSIHQKEKCNFICIYLSFNNLSKKSNLSTALSIESEKGLIKIFGLNSDLMKDQIYCFQN